jgi:hypothetical protein
VLDETTSALVLKSEECECHRGRARRPTAAPQYEGRLIYCYNFLGIDHFMVTAREPIPAGKHQARMEFKYDGVGLGKGGDVAQATNPRSTSTVGVRFRIFEPQGQPPTTEDNRAWRSLLSRSAVRAGPVVYRRRLSTPCVGGSRTVRDLCGPRWAWWTVRLALDDRHRCLDGACGG